VHEPLEIEKIERRSAFQNELSAEEGMLAEFGEQFAQARDFLEIVGWKIRVACASFTEFQVKRHGEDSRFEGSAIRVAANVLRDRVADVLQPVDLARCHHAYRCRMMVGPSYRADMWAALEEEPTLSAAALARRTYGLFATAWHVRRDFALLSRNLSPGSKLLRTHRSKHINDIILVGFDSRARE
jgi:hypothetical protein